MIDCNQRISTNNFLKVFAIFWMIVSSGFFVLNYVYTIPCILILLAIAGCFVLTNTTINKHSINMLGIVLLFLVLDEMATLTTKQYPFVLNTLIILLIRFISLTIIMSRISYEEFKKIYTNILVIIACVSLMCFVLVNTTSISLPFCGNYQDGFYGSFYFRVNEYTRSVTTRNAGPYGEPGMFAVYLIIALMFQLFGKNVDDITHGWNAVKVTILSATLLTTLSGTGLLCYLIILVVYAIGNDIKEIWRNPILLIIIVIMAIGFYYAETNFGVLETKLIGQGGSYGVRMNDSITGYQIGFENFFFGTGIANDYSTAWENVLLENSRSNGLANFTASVGIPFTLYYIFRLFLQAKRLILGKQIYRITFFGVLLIIFNTQPVVFQTIGLSFLLDWKENEIVEVYT